MVPMMRPSSASLPGARQDRRVAHDQLQSLDSWSGMTAPTVAAAAPGFHLRKCGKWWAASCAMMGSTLCFNWPAGAAESLCSKHRSITCRRCRATSTCRYVLICKSSHGEQVCCVRSVTVAVTQKGGESARRRQRRQVRSTEPLQQLRRQGWHAFILIAPADIVGTAQAGRRCYVQHRLPAGEAGRGVVTGGVADQARGPRGQQGEDGEQELVRQRIHRCFPAMRHAPLPAQARISKRHAQEAIGRRKCRATGFRTAGRDQGANDCWRRAPLDCKRGEEAPNRLFF